MTAANYAGLSRIPLTLVGAYLLLHVPVHGRIAAVGVVVLAVITDILDGALARKFGTVSTFGAMLDLTTDKVFVIPMLFLATRHDVALLWMAVLIAMRDFLVMGVRVYAAAEAVVIPAKRLGKLKTTLLYPALILVLLEVSGARVLLALAALMAVVSGIDYMRRAWPLLSQGLSPRQNQNSDASLR